MGGELSDEAKIRKDLLWGMYTDLRAHARHAETLRANVVNFMIVVASVLAAVIANDGSITRKDLPLCLAMAVVGGLGFAFAASYTELFERNRKRTLRIREELETEFLASGTTIATLLQEADAGHQASRLYRWSRRITGSTQLFWFALSGMVVLTSIVLSVIAL